MARIRRSYRRAGRGVFLLGFLSLGSGAAFFIDPESRANSALGESLPGPWDEMWALEYAVGGFSTCLGVMVPEPALEQAGLILMMAAILTNAIAVIALRGVQGGPALAAMGIALWVAWGRFCDLRAAYKQVTSDVK